MGIDSLAMARKVKLDSFHWHEALDRSMIVAETFAHYVQEHPAVCQTPALKKKANAIAAELFELYQAVGSHSAEEPPPGSARPRKMKSS